MMGSEDPEPENPLDAAEAIITALVAMAIGLAAAMVIKAVCL